MLYIFICVNGMARDDIMTVCASLISMRLKFYQVMLRASIALADKDYLLRIAFRI